MSVNLLLPTYDGAKTAVAGWIKHGAGALLPPNSLSDVRRRVRSASRLAAGYIEAKAEQIRAVARLVSGRFTYVLNGEGFTVHGEVDNLAVWTIAKAELLVLQVALPRLRDVKTNQTNRDWLTSRRA